MSRGLRTDYKRKRNFIPQKKKFFTKENVFLSRMGSILLIPPSKVKSLFSQRAVTTIRINPLKGDPDKTIDVLKDRGYNLEKVYWAENVFFVRNIDKSEISQIQEYKDGLFYIQNLSSILPALVLNPQKNDKILDMCAAPGSKTTHICALVNNKANIIANDSDPARMNAMRDVLHQFGADAKVCLNDGKIFGSRYTDFFDKILLDAPCSGEGLIYLNSNKPLRFWSIKKVNISSIIQRELIDSAFKALKPGGILVYSTCTLEPEENEGTITFLLEKYKNVKIEKIEIDGLKDINRGITKWSGNTYHQEVSKTIRIKPSSEMMGFYIAKIEKVRPHQT